MPALHTPEDLMNSGRHGILEPKASASAEHSSKSEIDTLLFERETWRRPATPAPILWRLCVCDRQSNREPRSRARVR